MALALPVFKMERFAWVRPMRLESYRELIFRLASITSKFTIIAMASPQMVRSFSSRITTAACITLESTLTTRDRKTMITKTNTSGG